VSGTSGGFGPGNYLSSVCGMGSILTAITT
jgi:hypothetical protein